jgi:hypothetical protein
MIAEIAAACSTAKNLHDLLKARKGSADSHEISAALGELMTQLLTAQTAAMQANEAQSALTRTLYRDTSRAGS